jgi:glycosyltransferase involved in cell wall biosynthesis
MPFFSILMPTYGHEHLIGETLRSIVAQNFSDYEIIVVPDGVGEIYQDVAEEWKGDARIRFFFDLPNVGYCRNLSRCLGLASGKYILYFASDDIMGSNLLETYADLYKAHPEVEAILRTYYAYEFDINQPVRAKRRLKNPLTILNVHDSSPSDIHVAMETLDQLTWLSFRAYDGQRLDNCDVFPCHAYPVLDIISKGHKFAYLSKDLMAVRIGASQCRSISSIYRVSPMYTWSVFVERYFQSPATNDLRKHLLRNWIGSNYVGLFQIRNFSERPYFYTVREMYYIVKLNPLAVFDPVFFICVSLCLLLPRAILLRLTDFIKLKAMRHFVEDIKGRCISHS